MRLQLKRSKQLRRRTVSFFVLAVMILSGSTVPTFAAGQNVTAARFENVPQSINQDTRSGLIGVRLLNANGEREMIDSHGNLALSSSSSTGRFARTVSSSLGETDLAFTSGNSRQSFTYQDSTPGDHTITATIKGGGLEKELTISTTITVRDTTASTAPVFSHPGGAYFERLRVSLTSTDNAAQPPSIFYTIDETSPTTSGIRYESPILIGRDTVLRAVAVDAAGNTSAISSQSYMVTIPADQTPPMLGDISQVATGSTVTLSGTTEPAARVSISDGTTVQEVIADESGAWSYEFSGREPGEYRLQVRAADVAGNVSEPKIVLVTIAPPPAPQPPTPPRDTDAVDTEVPPITQPILLPQPNTQIASLSVIAPFTPSMSRVNQGVASRDATVSSAPNAQGTVTAPAEVLGVRDEEAGAEQTVAAIRPSEQGWMLLGTPWYWIVGAGAAVIALLAVIRAVLRRRADVSL